jgi:hypothetical protein
LYGTWRQIVGDDVCWDISGEHQFESREWEVAQGAVDQHGVLRLQGTDFCNTGHSYICLIRNNRVDLFLTFKPEAAVTVRKDFLMGENFQLAVAKEMPFFTDTATQWNK